VSTSPGGAWNIRQATDPGRAQGGHAFGTSELSDLSKVAADMRNRSVLNALHEASAGVLMTCAGLVLPPVAFNSTDFRAPLATAAIRIGARRG
jgi:hypothetical protein